VFYKKLQTKGLKVFFIYAVLLAIFVILGSSAVYLFESRKSYMIILRIFSVIEYSCIAYFLYSIIQNKFFKRVILISILPFILFAFYNYFYSENTPGKVPNAAPILASLLIISFIIYYLYEKMKTVVMYPLSQLPEFWLCMGFFVYFAGTFFFFIFINYGEDRAFKIQLAITYSFVTLTKNLVLSIAMCVNNTSVDNQKQELDIPKDLHLDDFNLTNPNQV